MLKRIGAKTAKWVNGERGQYLILFVAVFSVILGLAAFAIDQGVWLGKRRVAQKDADAAALGGAQAFLSSLTDYAGAEQQAQLVAEQNLANTDPTSLTAFHATNTCTRVDGSSSDDTALKTSVAGVPSINAKINAPTRGLFTSLFGLGGISDLGAQATACFVRTTQLGEGIDPFYVSPTGPCFTAGDPDLGEMCTFKFGAQGGTPPDRGTLSLSDTSGACTQKSGSDLYQQVAEGSEATCAQGDLVYTKTGNGQSVIDAIRCRLAGYSAVNGGSNPCNNIGGIDYATVPGEGACDDPSGSFHDTDGRIPPFTGLLTGAHIDDLTEAFSLPAPDPVTGRMRPNQTEVETGSKYLVPNVCADTWRGDGVERPDHRSPRITTIIVSTGDPVSGNGGQHIIIDQFATFYILGCAREADVPADGSPVAADKIAPNCGSGNSGHNVLVGIFVKAYVPAGGCGDECLPPDDTGGSIILVR